MHTDIVLCHKPSRGWVAYVYPEGKETEYLPQQGYYETPEMAQRDATRLVRYWWPHAAIHVSRGSHVPQW